jgi:hypothetical protein
MTHRRWNATVKRGLALMDKSPQQAVRLFERLGQGVDQTQLWLAWLGRHPDALRLRFTEAA